MWTRLAGVFFSIGGWAVSAIVYWDTGSFLSALPFLAIGGIALLLLLIPLILWGYWMLKSIWQQFRHPERFIHNVGSDVTFLPISGGRNAREWICGLAFVSCLLRNLRLDSLKIKVIYPQELRSEQVVSTNVTTPKLSLLDTGRIRVGLGDGAYRWLAKLAQSGDRSVSVNLHVVGTRQGKTVFQLTLHGIQATIQEWGQNN